MKEERIQNTSNTVSSISDAGKTGQLHEKNEIRTFSHTTYKNKLKMNQRLKCKTRNHKTPERKQAEYSLT